MNPAPRFSCACGGLQSDDQGKERTGLCLLGCHWEALESASSRRCDAEHVLVVLSLPSTVLVYLNTCASRAQLESEIERTRRLDNST